MSNRAACLEIKQKLELKNINILAHLRAPFFVSGTTSIYFIFKGIVRANQNVSICWETNFSDENT